MDELTLLHGFRAECADGDPRARAAAWQALEARFDSAYTASPVGSSRVSRHGRRALAGGAALAMIAVALLVLSSGPTPDPAAANVLRRVAGVAADTPPETRPGPGQFIYKKTKALELEGWTQSSDRVSHGYPLGGAGAFTALVPTDHEFWASPEGMGRSREVVGAPQFLSGAEQSRWEQAGSPLPGPADPSGRNTILGPQAHVLEARRGVIDIERTEPMGGLGPNFGFADLKGLPNDPEALRHVIENKQAPVSGADPGGKSPEIKDMVLPLWGILQQPIVAPALRAAVFNALAELPGIELGEDATDLAGRSGYAIGYLDPETGLRSEYIFDPETSAILGERTVLAGPGRTTAYEELPRGAMIHDIAYLQSKIVESTREPAYGNGDPAATAGPSYRK